MDERNPLVKCHRPGDKIYKRNPLHFGAETLKNIVFIFLERTLFILKWMNFKRIWFFGMFDYVIRHKLKK